MFIIVPTGSAPGTMAMPWPVSPKSGHNKHKRTDTPSPDIPRRCICALGTAAPCQETCPGLPRLSYCKQLQASTLCTCDPASDYRHPPTTHNIE